MQRIAFVLAFVCFFTAAPAASEAPAPHDFHYSRFALEWNATTNTWQGILRVFTDDLENVLSRVTDSETAWRLGDAREAEDANDQIAAYACSRWTLLGASGEPMTWSFIGKEVDFDITYIYLESPPTTIQAVQHIESHGFSELFADQVNEISLTHAGHSLRLWLNEEDPVKPIDFQRNE